MNKLTLARKLGLAGVALGAMVVTAPLVQAKIVTSGYDLETPPQRVVSVKDLDLKQPADVAVLYARIRRAARVVCGGEPATGSRLPSIQQQACVTNSVEATVVTINRSALSAYHRHGKTGANERSRGAVN
jgi:UrcA family protein